MAAQFKASDWFGPEGELASVISGYEHRPQQSQMADAVWHALADHGRLAVEAGTGTGKSLAYLLPAALWAAQEKKRVLVSTYTRLLQTQLIDQDLRIAAKALGPFPVAVAYGQENYLCRFRLEHHVARGLFDTREEARAADELADWAARTEDGILLAYPHALPPALARRIGRDSAACRGRDCPYRRTCFYLAARQGWAKSALLVVNHSLFLSSSVGEADLLPEHARVIFDEAHRLEDVCARHFGLEVSQYALSILLGTLSGTDRHALTRLLPARSEARRAIESETVAGRTAVDEFFARTGSRLAGDATRQRLLEPLDTQSPAQSLERLALTIDEVSPDLDDELLAAELSSASRRLHRTASAFDGFGQMNTEANAYWLEKSAADRLNLMSAPLDVAPMLNQLVYDRLSSTVLTSATLTVGGEFDFFSSRLGLNGFNLLRLDSPFDYSRCSLLYIPPRLPLPTAPAEFHQAAAEEIDRLIKVSRGRALVLFTSYDALNSVFGLMPEGPYRFLRQGELTLPRLLDEFRKDKHSVLFATQSFWQGIDVPGEALSCLIICRLPFEVPDDPRLVAIAEKLRQQGLDPFVHYQLPTAVLRFRQGFGRLIRTAQDRGVVCVLDRRITDRAYGRLFLNSLPDNLPATSRVTDVADFFSQDN